MRAIRLFHPSSPPAEEQCLSDRQRFASGSHPPELCALLSPRIRSVSLVGAHQKELYANRDGC